MSLLCYILGHKFTYFPLGFFQRAEFSCDRIKVDHCLRCGFKPNDEDKPKE